MRTWLGFTGFMAVTLVLARFIPFSAFFRNVNTLIHEMSHAVMTLLVSGKVMSIHLFADQSGVTYSMVSAGWKLVPISLAGYTGSALFALLLFKLLAAKEEKMGLYIIAIITVIGMVLFVRNGYGLLWCTGFVVVTILISNIPKKWPRIGYYLLIAFLCLVESVVSSFTILYLSITSPSAAGDAANLADATFIPALIWGSAFTLFSLWCGKNCAVLLTKNWRSIK